MIITENRDNGKLIMNIEGRLDTGTAPQLDAAIEAAITGTSELVLNMEKLDYVSSAGLRVLLKAQKAMNKQGSMVIRNVNDTIMEVFDITGFVDILTIE